MSQITIQDVQEALTLTPFDVGAAHQLMAPFSRKNNRPQEMTGSARIGGVLLLLYCFQNELHLILTRRRDDLNAHAGQISFPGGRREPAETTEMAALRETHEEVGVLPQRITVLGQLTTIWIPPSDFMVYPFVGWVHSGERPSFTPAVDEVAELLEVPLGHLLDPQTKKEGLVEGRGYRFTVPYFDVQGQMVWGATAIMLSEFVERLRFTLTVDPE